jgi:hypothetical protein
MRLKQSVMWFVVGLSVAMILVAAFGAYPHGGGLDPYGCHHSRKAGGYHCHRGPLARQSFSSQQEMPAPQAQTRRKATASAMALSTALADMTRQSFT